MPFTYNEIKVLISRNRGAEETLRKVMVTILYEACANWGIKDWETWIML